MAPAATQVAPTEPAHTPQTGHSAWDTITELCLQQGFMVHVVEDRVIIENPRTFFDPRQAVRFVWGRNLKTLKIKKHLGRRRDLNVEVLSYDPARARTLTGRYPTTAVPKARPSSGSSSGSTTETVEVTRFVVSNVTDQGKLDELARSFYEQVVREDTEGEFETIDSVDLGGKPVFAMRNGNAVIFSISADGRAFLSDLPSEAAREEYLVGRGYTPGVAHTIATHIEILDVPFFVRKVRLGFTADEGFKLHVDFVNFLEADGAAPGGAA